MSRPITTRTISDLHSKRGLPIAERDCRNLSRWVILWVRIVRLECSLSFGMGHRTALDPVPIPVRISGHRR